MSFMNRSLVPWLLLPVALAVVACGGDDPTATPVPTATSAPDAPAPTATPDAEAKFQAEWAALIKAAQGEELIIEAASSAGRDYRPVAEAFAEKFGVTTTFTSGGDQDARLLVEQSAGKFLTDIAMISSSPGIRLYKGGGVEEMPPLFMHPEVLDQSLWFQGRHWWVDPEQKYVMFYGANHSPLAAPVWYNTDRISADQLFDSFWDLLKPEFSSLAIGSLPPPDQPGPWGNMGIHPDLGWDWVAGYLALENVEYTTSRRLHTDGLAQGKWDMILFSGGDTRRDLSRLVGLGIPVAEYKGPVAEAPTISLGGSTKVIMIPKNPPHRNATILFINWYLSRDGQTTRQALGGSAPPPTLRIDDIPQGNVPDDQLIQPGVEYFVPAHPDNEGAALEARVTVEAMWNAR